MSRSWFPPVIIGLLPRSGTNNGFLRGRGHREIVGAEWRCRQAILVPEVDYRVVGPAKADGDRLLDFLARDDDFIFADFRASAVEDVVLAGDREARQRAAFGDQAATDLGEADDRLGAFRFHAFVNRAGVLDLL